MHQRAHWFLAALAAVLAACGGATESAPVEPTSTPAQASEPTASIDDAVALPCVVGPPPAGSPAAQLDWMIGAWVSDEEGTETTERWCAGEGGALVGTNVTPAGARVVHSERLRIEARGDALVYVASPSSQATTEFTGHAECGSDVLAGNCDRSCEAVFENPEHDFPTEIVYGACVGSGVMVATIRGGDRRESWTFRRTPDDGEPR